MVILSKYPFIVPKKSGVAYHDKNKKKLVTSDTLNKSKSIEITYATELKDTTRSNFNDCIRKKIDI